MAKGLFNRIYVGDPKREDLTKEALAGRSRLQVFWEVIVSQIWKLIGINLMEEGFGSAAHPSLKTHIRMGRELAKRIRQLGLA